MGKHSRLIKILMNKEALIHVGVCVHCCTCVLRANACISVSTVCFCINNSGNVTKTQQEEQGDKGLCQPEGIPTLWEKKCIRVVFSSISEVFH